MVLTRRYKTARCMAQALSVAYAENVTGRKDKQVLFHTKIRIVRTRDFIAFRSADFGGVFSYGQPLCATQRRSICVDSGGLALCGCCYRSLLAARCRLVDEGCDDSAARHRCPGDG